MTSRRFTLIFALLCLAAGPVVSVTLPDGTKWSGELQPAQVAQPATAPATLPATLPATVPSVPALPAMTSRIAPNIGLRGDGYRLPPAQTSAAHFVADGWEQNIVVENHPLPCTLSDFQSLRAHRPQPEPAGTYRGQGLYLDKCGPIAISGYYARQNGWQQGQPPAQRDRFRHHIYSNFGVESLTVEDSWLDDAACAAIQSRGKACTIRRCFITANGIALLMVGPATIEDCTIYSGHCYHFPADPVTKRPASWAGDVALQAYYPCVLNRVWIVGKPGQGADVTSIPGIKTYHLGAVVSGGDYSKSEWSPPVGPDGKRITKLVSASNCFIVGWPGPAFAGDARHDGSGFTVAGKPINVDDQISAIRADMEARKITIADAVARAQALVRGAATKGLQ